VDVSAPETRGFLGIQVFLVIASALAFLIAAGASAAGAAAYGGATALLNAWMLARRVRSASDTALQAPERGALSLYLGAVQRFVTVLALLILGMGWLQLAPLPLIVGFVVGQVGFIVGAARLGAGR